MSPPLAMNFFEASRRVPCDKADVADVQGVVDVVLVRSAQMLEDFLDFVIGVFRLRVAVVGSDVVEGNLGASSVQFCECPGFLLPTSH